MVRNDPEQKRLPSLLRVLGPEFGGWILGCCMLNMMKEDVKTHDSYCSLIWGNVIVIEPSDIKVLQGSL